MKKLNFIYLLSATALSLGMISCGGNSKPEDTKEVAQEQNDANKDTKSAEKDADFVVNAAEINLEEIQLGQLAQTKGMTAEVKDLGKMMEAAHTKAMADLKNLASQKNIAIPTSLTENGQDAYKKLSDKTGTDFDKEYADMMIKGHKDAIDKFDDASKNANDADIKAWATSMLPDLNTHLEHATMTKDKLK